MEECQIAETSCIFYPGSSATSVPIYRTSSCYTPEEVMLTELSLVCSQVTLIMSQLGKPREADTLDCRLDDPGFVSWQGQEMFLTSKSSRPAVGAHLSFYSMRTAQLHLIPRLKINAAVPSFPPFISSRHVNVQVYCTFPRLHRRFFS